MPTLKPSIFDSNHASKYLWSKTPTDYVPNNHKIIYEGYLCKFSKTKNTYIDKYFILTSTSLLYVKRKGSGTIYRSLGLEWSRVFYEPIVDVRKEAHLVIFVKNMKYSKFLIRDQKDLEQWRRGLAKSCFQTEFLASYDILGLLGRGAFASVYLANNKTSNNKYAVKAYSKNSIRTSSVHLSCLIDEIQILRMLDHPNIARLTEIFESETSVYIVQEYVSDTNLGYAISKTQEFTIEEIARVLQTSLQCLAYLSTNKIMHRDLKPANIMVIYDHNNKIKDVKLIDFGLSIITSKTSDNAVCGTPGYMPPELLRDDVISSFDQSKADVFSLGVVIYTMIHGQKPFSANTKEEILQLNKRCIINYSGRKMDRLPDLSGLLTQMLLADPSKRISPVDALNHKFFGTLSDTFNNNTGLENKGQGTISSKMLTVKNLSDQQIIS